MNRLKIVINRYSNCDLMSECKSHRVEKILKVEFSSMMSAEFLKVFLNIITTIQQELTKCELGIIDRLYRMRHSISEVIAVFNFSVLTVLRVY